MRMRCSNSIFLTLAFALVAGFWFGACSVTLPSPVAYPESGWDFNKIVDDAKQINDDLEAYIRDFIDGNVSGNIPRSIMPFGVDPNLWALDGFYIVKGTDAINFSKRQFLYGPEYMHDPNRPGWVTDPNSLGGMYRTGQSTYIIHWSLWMPWNHTLKITGKFPHCRLFDIQVGPPFDPYVYRYKGYAGPLETPIVDVDIEPDNGSVNPFRIGQNRNATNRNYTVNFVMKSGRYIDFDPNYCPRPPYYRGTGNTRYGSAIHYQGPWGDPNYAIPQTASYGRWDFGQVWIRYYSPDKAWAPYAGSFDPNDNTKSTRMVMYTQYNEPYYIYGDDSRVQAWCTAKIPSPLTDPAELQWTELNDYNVGKQNSWWSGPTKMMDIGYSGYASIVASLLSSGYGSLPSPYTDWKLYTRDCVKGFSGKGESQPDIGSWEASTSCVNYYSIISMNCTVGSDKVVAFTGKLPTYNPTRNGETSNVAAQCRMWIFDTYSDNMNFTDNKEMGLNAQCLIDDEVVIDANRRYIIVVSSAANRPSNAYSANGVSWIDNWGNNSSTSSRLRWCSVGPEWYMTPTLHETPLGWKSLPQSSDFDPNWIGYNRHDRYMGWYLPKRHYMTKQEFEEQREPRLNPAMINTWKDPNNQFIKPYGWTEKYSTTTFAGGDANIILTSVSGRYVMVECLGVAPGKDCFQLDEMKVFDSGGTNRAYNQPTRSSCHFDAWWGPEEPKYAFDDDLGTSWNSSQKPQAWIYVDLGANYSIPKIVLNWPASGGDYAASYKIYVANDLY